MFNAVLFQCAIFKRDYSRYFGWLVPLEISLKNNKAVKQWNLLNFPRTGNAAQI